jgi:hypothetical protein
MEKRAIFWLKLAFLLGAIIDGLMVIPMAIPWAANLMWGYKDFNSMYYAAMGMGASLMFAWTILLVWAYRKPLERRYIALFTMIIVAGFVLSEIIQVFRGYAEFSNILFSLVVQAVILTLYGYGFYLSGKVIEKKKGGV